MATRQYLTMRTTVLLVLAVVVASQIALSWYNAPVIKGAHPAQHPALHPAQRDVRRAASHQGSGEQAEAPSFGGRSRRAELPWAHGKSFWQLY